MMKSSAIFVAPLVLALVSCGGAGTDPLAISQGSILLFSSGVNEVDANTGVTLRTFPVAGHWLSISRDRILIASLFQGYFSLYNVVTGTTTYPIGNEQARGIAFLDDGNISFWRNGSVAGQLALVTMRPDGSDATELYSHPFDAESRGLLSPNGQLVLHINSVSGNNEIELRGASGAVIRLLRDQSEGPIRSGPAWSPDSKSICYATDTEVNMIDVLSGTETEIIQFARSTYPRIKFVVPYQSGTRVVQSRLSWSDNGRAIVFNADYDNNMNAFIVGITGGSVRPIAPLEFPVYSVFWGS